jgi:hypothetical protein
MKSRQPLSLALTIAVLMLWGFSCALASAIEAPLFFLQVPSGHFAGVSASSTSVAEARVSAVSDVVRQVLQSVGGSHSYSFQGRASGNPNSAVGREVDERSESVLQGIVLDVPRRIVKSEVVEDSSGRYVCFILVDYPDVMVSEMRRLSRGANVSLSVVRLDKSSAVLRVHESNGVGVTITSAEVLVEKVNRFAKKISYFVIKVPEGSSERFRVSFSPVTVCKGSREVRLDLSDEKGLSDYLLGADVRRAVTVLGTDEVGRGVVAEVRF